MPRPRSEFNARAWPEAIAACGDVLENTPTSAAAAVTPLGFAVSPLSIEKEVRRGKTLRQRRPTSGLSASYPDETAGCDGRVHEPGQRVVLQSTTTTFIIACFRGPRSEPPRYRRSPACSESLSNSS